ncbi:DUF4160 domain-containing protein [Candidatus Sumerlaeota bacterium]|nr:DUF4160 domain-containing protein [Candidatus Sumerlaeota bacterium]
MPTIDRVGPYRIFFFSNESNEPPHVHVQRDTMLAKFWLHPSSYATSRGFAAHELRRIEEIVTEKQEQYLEAWNEYFGA